MRGHYSFARSGCSGRVKQSRRVVLSHSFLDSALARLFLHHVFQCSHYFGIGRALIAADKYDREVGVGEFGDELGSGEGEDWVGIGNLLGDFASCVEGVCGGDYGSERHDRETDNGEEDGVRGEEEDDVAFADPHGREGGGDGIDGHPDLSEGELAGGGGVDEGDLAWVGLGGDEGGDIEGVVGRQRDGLAFAVEDGV